MLKPIKVDKVGDCKDPRHNPPTFLNLGEGQYEWICDTCGFVTEINIPAKISNIYTTDVPPLPEIWVGDGGIFAPSAPRYQRLDENITDLGMIGSESFTNNKLQVTGDGRCIYDTL